MIKKLSENKIETKKAEDVALSLKDQPDGKCFECRWNSTELEGGFHCLVPYNHVSNKVCIMKNQLVYLTNIYHAMKDM